MEYNQFRQLLQLKGIREKETISQLEDFIEKFPYCQTSRLLLAKALHDQDSIHYDRSLKLAAAYASSREVLRKLIETKTEETEYEFPLQAKSNSHQPSVLAKPEGYQPPVPEAEVDSVNAPPVPAPVPEQKKEERFEEWYSDNEISGRAFIEQKENEKLVDPHEVIRQRLNEILIGVEAAASTTPGSEDVQKIQPEARVQERPVIPPSASEPVKDELKVSESVDEIIQPSEPKATPVQEPQETLSTESKIITGAGQAKDVLDKMELEHAMEESILESLTKLPVIAPEKKFGEKISDIGAFAGKGQSATPSLKLQQSDAERETPRSFAEWLKVFQPGSSGFEEIHAPSPKPAVSLPVDLPLEASDQEHEPDSHLSDDELIEKFLLEDPKIHPSKAEFYSPVNQAKKSVMDHDDVVSETLAKIYLTQGNTRKARWCYERLMLLHPEKSAFFAALLKEIDDQPNNKEDL